nr:2'-5' RNA ligase family protein [Rubrobacter indicoceani]
MRPFPFVSLHPDHFMHISLVIVGFLTAAPESPDEFSEEGLASLAESAGEAVSGFGEFRIDLANLGLFPSAAFIEAHDRNGEIDILRDALLVGCGLQSKPGPPHLTLAYFKVEEETDAPEGLIEAVEPLRNRTVGSFTARHVDLTVLDLCSEYARPKVFARLPLR